MDDWGKSDLCFTPALTFYPLPQERKWLLDVSGLADGCPANPVAQIVKGTADDSPSPWGEGRDEGGREPFEIHIPQGQRVVPTRRTKLGDDGNQIGAHSALFIPHLNGFFPEFSSGWTIGANGVWRSRSDSMTIARHFNAGLVVKSIQVPEGRPSLPDEM